MGAWASIAAATSALRTFVNDGPTDRLVKEKTVINATDGVNKTFLTWDERVIPGSLAVTVDYVPAPVASQVTDPASGLNLLGQFDLTTAPAAGSAVRAQYYFQYFLDSELQEGLEMAAQELNESDDISTIVPGLKYSALNFAGSFCYQKLAIRWAQKMSNRFLVIEEPANNDNMQRPNMFLQMANQMWNQAVKLRDSFYMRHGRRNAPSFAVFKPRSGYPYGPRR